MITLDKWIVTHKDRDGFLNKVTNELAEEEETISNLVKEEKYWEAFNRESGKGQ